MELKKAEAIPTLCLFSQIILKPHQATYASLDVHAKDIFQG